MEQEKELIAIFYSTRSVGKKEKKKKITSARKNRHLPPKRFLIREGEDLVFA